MSFLKNKSSQPISIPNSNKSNNLQNFRYMSLKQYNNYDCEVRSSILVLSSSRSYYGNGGKQSNNQISGGSSWGFERGSGEGKNDKYSVQSYPD